MEKEEVKKEGTNRPDSTNHSTFPLFYQGTFFSPEKTKGKEANSNRGKSAMLPTGSHSQGSIHAIVW